MAYEKTSLDTKTKSKVKKPSLYKVIMHNDNYTTMQFVVSMLMSVFNRNKSQAVKIMFDIHKKGAGIAGIYPKEIAETKVDMVHFRAREKGFPLRCSLEKES
ncbi:MAG: ATP-dependent Clp protease adaptor ClpS [Spirochaetia bacterium]|nr:ATP-dependent Clp protease adaptor ClpS [Spirochaetia bacterium]